MPIEVTLDGRTARYARGKWTGDAALCACMAMEAARERAAGDTGYQPDPAGAAVLRAAQRMGATVRDTRRPPRGTPGRLY